MLRSLSSLYGSKEAVFLPPIEISPVRFDLDSISRGMVRSVCTRSLRSIRSILWFASKLYLKACFTSYSFKPSYELMTLLEIVKQKMSIVKGEIEPEKKITISKVNFSCDIIDPKIPKPLF